MARKRAPKEERIEFVADPELRDKLDKFSEDYSQETGHTTGLSATIRAILRHWLTGNRGQAYDLPAGAIEEELKRAPRRKRKKSEDD